MTDVLRPSRQTDDPASVPVPLRMTFDEFMAWDPECGRAEWVNGEVVLVSPASLGHQLFIFFLAKLLDPFVEPRALGQVIMAPFLMRLAQKPSGREPDIMFIAAEHFDRLTETCLNGPADLVVEVLSPDSEIRDRVDKLQEYEEAGIPEYWLFDRLRSEAFFFRLGADGRYHLAPADQDGIYHSQVLEGFRLRVDWLWRQPLPTLSEALRELPV